MDFNDDKYIVEFTDDCIEEITGIYEYITYNLKNNFSAQKIIRELLDKILALDHRPKIYIKIHKFDKLKREYRRIVVKNFVALYTIDYSKKKIYISHVFYNKRNYLF